MMRAEAATGLRPRVDCHTHVGLADEHVGGAFMDDLVAAWSRPLWDVQLDEHIAEAAGADAAVVLAFDAPAVGVQVPNEYVADYAARAPERLIPFASVDPSRPNAPRLLDHAIAVLGMRGLKLAPIYQHFHPHDGTCFDLLEVAAAHRIPVIWHQGTTFVRDAPLEVARPALLDRVARRFPELPMWIAHLGHPWCEEAMATIRKHPHVYADISAMHTRPVQFYFALTSALEYGVIDRLLFGSDYPFSTIAQTLTALRNINNVREGTGLPAVPQDQLTGIVLRDTLALLGLRTDAKGA